MEAKEGVKAEAVGEKRRGEGKSMLGAVRKGEIRVVKDEQVLQFGGGQVQEEEQVLLLVGEETVREGAQQAEQEVRGKKSKELAGEKSAVGRRIEKKTCGLGRHSQGQTGGRIVLLR